MNQPWLRAGLIGAGTLIVVNLLGLVIGFGLLSLLLLIALAGAGALAASFIPPRRQVSRGAGQGALAGLMSGLAGGITYSVMFGAGISAAGGVQGLVDQLPAQLLDQYRQMGVDPATVLSGGILTMVLVLCCLPTFVGLGALLGALGGAIFAGIKPE